ncbi:MAG: hypothetical protein II317_00415 [Clostridia bacterium]|nr:hypothetical protein [Clostridia bacterium]
MKSLSKKTLSVILLVAVVLSCFAVSYGTALAEEPTYSYEKEVTVDIPMDASAWAKTVNSSDENFKIYTVENSLTGKKTLNIKSGANASSKKVYVWEPYKDAQTETLFDPATVTKVELVAIYNTFYPRIITAKNKQETQIVSVEGAQQKPPSKLSTFSGEDFQTVTGGERKTFTVEDSFDFTKLQKNSVFKTVTKLNSDGWQCTAFNVVEGQDEQMYVASQTNSQKDTYNLYPAVGVFDISADVEILSMKVTYTQTVDVTDEVTAFANDYPTYFGCESIADITANNAPTIINEIRHLKAAYTSRDSQFQNILVNAGIYDASKLDEFLSIAEKLRSGLIGQYFNKDISGTKIIDDLWSARGNKNLTISGGKLAMNSLAQQICLTNGLATAPKSLVIKAEFADNTADNLAAGLYFKYAQKLLNTGADNSYFWIQLPTSKQDSKLVAVSSAANEIRGQQMKINSTDSSTWLDSHITYPTENPIVIGTYDGEDNYTPNEITVTIDYVKQASGAYKLNFTVSDGTNSVTQASSLFLPAQNVSDYSFTVSGCPYNNDGNYKAVTNYGNINSIEYLMPENGVDAPTVDGVHFLDLNNGKTDITFQVSTNTASAPEGYTPIAYGAHIITNQVLNNKYDIINASYIGKRNLPVITARKAVSDGAVPTTFNVSISGSADKLGTIDCRGVRFAAVGFVTYQTADGREVTVYSQNTNDDRAINEGQGNRSIIGVAKIIAAYEINSMSGKDGAAAANTIAEVKAIIAKTTATNDAEKETLIKFVTDYKNFAN